MKRILSLLCAAVLLYGCGAAAQPPEPVSMLRISLAIPADADAISLQTAQAFAKRVSEASQQQLLVELVQTADAAGALTDGSCGLALVPSGRIAALVPQLGIVAQPFFWKDYAHFTTAMNLPENLELTSLLAEPALGARVLGVYYGGSVTLLARKRVYDELALEKLSIALPPESLSLSCFEALGARVQLLPRQEAVGAFMRSEISLIEGSVADIPSLTTGQNTVHVLPLDHYILGEWLLLSEELAKTLTAPQLAALNDGLAVSMEQNDRARQEQETTAVVEQAADGVTRHEGGFFSITHAAGCRYLFEQVVPQSGWSDQLIEALLMGNRPGRY